MAQGQMVEDFTKSDGWRWIKDRLTEKIMDLQSIRNIAEGDPQQVVLDIKARNAAVDILIEVIRDLEGRASQHANNKPPLPETNEIIIIQE